MELRNTCARQWSCRANGTDHLGVFLWTHNPPAIWTGAALPYPTSQHLGIGSQFLCRLANRNAGPLRQLNGFFLKLVSILASSHSYTSLRLYY